MLNRLLAWTRRNTRKAAALAIAPGLIFLATDAWIEHFIANAGDLPLQWAPIIYGVSAAVILSIVVVFRSRAPFAWASRILGVIGVLVGVAGTLLHLQPLLKEMNGTWDWPTLQGALGVSPPMFAPLAFAGIGSLVFLLASPKLLIRIKIGRPAKDAQVVPMADKESRRAG